MDGDALFQLVFPDEFPVQWLLYTFANDVERPFRVLPGKEVEGLYQQVETLVLR